VATIRERSGGVWKVRVFTGRDDTGRPTQTSKTVRCSRREAQRVAAALEVRPAASAGRTVAGAWVDHSRPTWAPQTERDQVSRAQQVARDPTGSVRLARLTVPNVEGWHDRLRRAGVGEGSIRNRHQAQRAALTQAMRWGWIAANPAAVARLGKRKQAVRSALLADDVRPVLRRPATAARSRWIPPRWRSCGACETSGGAFGPWILGIGDDPPNPERITWWWRRSAREVGLDPKWHLHDLRHFSATMAIAAGHDIRTVANRLGHANPAMTLRVYAHAVATADAGIAATLTSALDGPDGS
jgi:integrase